MKPKVFIYGAGAVGATLAQALKDANYPVLGCYLRNKKKAELLKRKIGLPCFSGVWPSIIKEANILFITLRDDLIPGFISKIAAANLLGGNVTLFHCSGLLSADVLDQTGGLIRAKGALHPLLSIKEPVFDRGFFKGAFFTVEGDPYAVGLGEKIVKDLEGIPIKLSKKFKPFYHLSATCASNYLVILAEIAFRLMVLSQIPESQAQRLVLSLIKSTVANLEKGEGFLDMLTGPLVRGDRDTLRVHLDTINRELPWLKEIYVSLGRQAVSFLKERFKDATWSFEALLGQDDLTEDLRSKREALK